MLLKDVDTAVRQDADRSVDHGVDILVRDGDIVEVGEGLSGEDVVDCGGKIALPGLVNCHTHTPSLLTRGLRDDLPLFPWLAEHEQALERADRADKRAAARLAVATMLETGTTTVNDMWNTYLVDEFVDVGVRAFAGCGLAEFEGTAPGAVEERLETNRAFAEEYRAHPTVHPAVPVHSVYRATPDLLRRAHDVAATRDLPFHVHVSETRRENEDCREEHGVTPTGLLDRLGVLDHRGVLAHCVHLTDDDRDRIAGSGAGVAHCPASNLKLGSGIADVPTMDGVPVGLGTDGAASNNSLNLFREGRTAALVHKRDDPGAVTAQWVLDAMTREAAAALGVADEIGSLEAGKRADVVLLDADDPTLHPSIGDEGLLSNLVYSFHGRVEATIVEGEFVVEDGTAVADVGRAADRVQAFCTAIDERRDGST